MNKCRALLKNAIDLGKLLPDGLKIFAVSLERFNRVVTSCFGKRLIPVSDSNGRNKNYEELILEFHQTFLKLNIPPTPKLHALMVHVPMWCHRNQTGLGARSEQASEAVHFDFSKKWEHFCVKESNKMFGDRLARCVAQYNRGHV